MNFNKFFELAKKEGLEASEIRYSQTTSLSISLFHQEINNYSVSDSSTLSARGIINGKFGSCYTEKIESSSFDFLVNGIKNTAKLVDNDDEAIIYQGGDKYKKRNLFNKNLENWDVKDILTKLHELEDKLKAADEKVSEVEVSFSKEEGTSILANSYGVNLKQRSNIAYVVGEVVMKQGDDIKTGFDLQILSDPSDFDVDRIVKKVIEKTNAKFGAETIESKTYKAILSQKCVATLIGALCESLSSENVQKHSSFFEGKLGQKVLSSKLTVQELPYTKNIFYSYFDDEGVPTQNKTLINKGVIETFFYNLLTAKKDGVKSTGNGRVRGSKTTIAYSSIHVKPGRASFDELVEKVHDGVYITDLQGLHAGLNSNSGDFSLQAEGFAIKDGKISKPLTLITVSSNLFKLFSEIIAVGSDKELQYTSTSAPSIAFKHLKVSAS